MSDRADVNVIGAGYVGLVTAACLARVTGARVRVVESDPARLEKLRDRGCPFHEPGLESLLRSRRLSFDSALAGAETHILCVGTPQAPGGGADLSSLLAAVRMLKDHASARRGSHVIAVKSTVPPGTLERHVAPEFEGSTGIHLASNPEFLREGCAVKDGLRPDRILVGTHSELAWKRLAALYAPFRGARIVRCSPAEAELGKYANNALFAMLISFSNELSRIADAQSGVTPIAIDRVLENVLLDRRWRDGARGLPPSIAAYLKSGCGFGGSCFPKDVSALAELARSLKVQAPVLEGILPANQATNAAWAERALSEARRTGARGPVRIAVLGLAFKADTDDVRESPAIGLIKRVVASGARVRVHDPRAVLPGSLPREALSQVDDAREALRGADVCVLVTAWDEYRKLEERDFSRLMRNPVLLDGRGLYADRDFRKVTYVRIGTGSPGIPR